MLWHGRSAQANQLHDRSRRLVRLATHVRELLLDRAHSFDFTLTFCEVMPLSDKEIKEAEADHIVRAPVKMKVVVPVQFVPNLIAALQEHWRVFSESYTNVGWNKGGPIH